MTREQQRLERLVEHDRLDARVYDELTPEWEPMEVVLHRLIKKAGYGPDRIRWRWPKLLDALKRLRERGACAMAYDDTYVPPQYQIKKGKVIA